MFQTRHTRVAGIGNTQGSQRAMNLLVAIRDIQQRTGRDLGATFLSGTGGGKCADRIVCVVQILAAERVVTPMYKLL